MRIVVFCWFFFYFFIASVSGGPVRSKHSSRLRRSIDLISSLEHVSDVRLPRDVTPTGYNLELQPFLEEGEFQGHVTINMTCLEDTDKIILHAHQELEITEADMSVYLVSSNFMAEKEKTANDGSSTTTAATTTTMKTTTTTATPVIVKATELSIAPVPVGAARLVPVSSSFIPENACSSVLACASNPGQEKESDKLNGREMLPKPEAVVSEINEEQESDFEKSTTKAEQVTQESIVMEAQEIVQPEQSETSEKSVQSQLIPLVVSKTERQLSKQWYIIYVTEGLKRGENYQVNLKFAGALLTNSKDGFFLESYVNKMTGERRYYVATQLRPNHARRVFPCFDEPSYKVPFDIHIARDPNMVAISNMPVMHTEQSPTEKEWVWDHFYPTPPMSTFSLAVLISDLQQVQVSKPRENVDEPDKVKVWGRKEMLSPLKNAVKIAPKILNEMEKFFGMPLPVPKLDLVALPGYTAIPDSNWGVIFFKESDLYFDEHLSRHISREIVYQWIGNLITPHWWTEVHLSKALCNFIAYLISLKVDNTIVPNSGLWTKTYPLYYEYGRNQPYKLLPSQKPPKTVTKSELILRMLNYTLSGETFQKAIQQLLGERQYKTFTQDDIWGYLTEQAGMDGSLPEPATINQIASSWVNKERLPLVTVTRNYANNSATAEQTVFIRDHLDENSTEVEENLTWVIPLIVISQNNLNFTSMRPMAWMKEESKIIINDLPSSSFFIIVNPEEIGPFIVNYDLHNWYMLSEFLEKYGNNGQIPAATRAKLIHDSLNLAYAGNLKFGAALNMTKFLYNEKDPIVWQAAFNMFDHILRHLEGSETGKKFQEYIKYILSNVYSYLEKIESKQTKNQERMYKSAKSALCNAGYKPCVREARTQWKKWMDFSEPDSGIPPKETKLLNCLAVYGNFDHSWYRKMVSHLVASYDGQGSTSGVFCPHPEGGYKTSNCFNVDSTVAFRISQSHFCWVFKWGTKEEWEFGLERYLKYPPTHKQADRYYLLKTLVSCPNNAWNVERLLNMTILDPNATVTDGNVRFILSVLSNQAGYAALFNLLSDNWDAIRSRFDNKESGLWDNIVSAATRNFKDQDGLDMVSELYVERQGEFGTAESVIEQSLKHIKKEVKWNEDNLSEIDMWLTNYLNSRSSGPQMTEDMS